MEKKYTLLEVTEPEAEITPGKEEYPFKKYLFETAVAKGRTDIKDKEEFDRNIELYKLIKENLYLAGESFKVETSDFSEDITREEAEMVVSEMETKIQSVKKILDKAREALAKKNEVPKIVVYTCITGGYDNILEPTFVTEGIDYVCFTDDKTLKSKTWKFRPIPEELLSFSKVKQQRAVKILAHRYLSEYDISIWVDGAVVVKGDINEYIKSLDLTNYSVFIPEHPARKCIYAEKEACVKIKKIKGDEITLAEKQMKRYKDEGFPANYGLVQSNIMVRRHNDPYSMKLMEKWWSELKDYSHRDQLSFNYALWKCGNDKFKYLGKTTCNSKTFNWIKVHKKKK